MPIFKALPFHFFFQSKAVCFVNKVDAYLDPPIYHLSDIKGNIIKFSYYKPQLTKIEPNRLTDYFIPDKIIEKKVVDGVEKYLVTFKFQSRDFKRWLTKDEFVKRKK